MRALRVLGALVVAALAVVGLLALIGAFDDGASSAAARDDGVAAAGRINRIYERASPGVVFIQAEVGPQPRRALATGTGFVIDAEGRIITNAHVVERARDVRVRFGESTLIDADVIGLDDANDLALLRVDPGDEDLHPLPLGDSGTVDVGDPVVAIGNPLGLRDTITSGIVSAEHRRITSPNGVTIDDVIQIEAAVNPGNSGRPLLDAAGRVIGVNAQIATAGGRGFIGIAFAIPVETVKRVVADLEDDGEIDRPNARRHRGHRDAGAGAPARSRHGPRSARGERGAAHPAARIGLHGDGAPTGALTGEGDVIVRVGDDRIRSSGDLAGAIGSLRPGTTVELEYVRAGRHRTVEVRPAARG